VYDDLECSDTFTEPDGVLDNSLISPEKLAKVQESKLFLDCLWKIEMGKDHKVC
jgi:hypothetical protein